MCGGNMCGVGSRVTAVVRVERARVAIDVRGRERSCVCAYRISGVCCVSEPSGEGTW